MSRSEYIINADPDRAYSRSFAYVFEEHLEFAGAGGMTHLVQSLGFDLANPLAGDRASGYEPPEQKI